MILAMTRAEREAFLAGLHVGVLALADGAKGPLAAPIWYAYEPGGELWLVTGRDSRKGRLLAQGRRIGFVVQSETPPYQYVSVEGSVVALEDADVERDVRPLARRYLGRELGDRYVEATGGTDARGGSVLVRVRPERWLSVDYRKQFP
jgi:nitroimidazol reductase NimA-like FMN-containing flavoprotein (pyridoxamine 5'-phosphate oxidase superfamily)